MPEIRRSGYFLIAILAAAVIVSFMWKTPSHAKFRAISENLIPWKIAGFVGREESVAISTQEALESAQLINRQYESGDGFRVDFALIAGSDRESLHDPRSCLTGAGGTIDDDRTEVFGPDRIVVRSCNVRYGGNAPSLDDIVYFYFSKDGSIASATQIRMRLLASAFLLQRAEPIYFIRYLTAVPVTATPQERHAIHGRLLGFATQMWAKIGPGLVGKVNHS